MSSGGGGLLLLLAFELVHETPVEKKRGQMDVEDHA
jgi:hypothetical protein